MPNYTKKKYSSDYQQNMQNNKKIKDSKCGMYLQNSGKQTAKDTKNPQNKS